MIRAWSLDIMSKALFLSALALCSYLVTEYSYRHPGPALLYGILGIALAQLASRQEIRSARHSGRTRVLALTFVHVPAGLALLGLVQDEFSAALPAIVEWIFLAILFHSASSWSRESLIKGARVALAISLTWSLVWLIALHLGFVRAYFMNEMIVAFSLVGLMALSARTDRDVLYATVGGVAISFLLGVESGTLAVLGGALVAVVRGARMRGLLLAIAGAMLVLHLWSSPRTFDSRLHLWSNALEAALDKPLTGKGGAWQFADLPGSPPAAHAHNLIVSSFTRWGFVGLGMCLFVLWQILKEWKNFDSSQRLLVAIFLLWSLVDEPLYWWGSAGLMVISVALNENVRAPLIASETEDTA